MARLPEGDVAFLLTDIEGSTALYRRLGDAYESMLSVHNDVLRQAVASVGGAELKSTGDGFIFAFGSATDAVAAAVKGQAGLVGAFGADELRVRMGVHRGPARVVDGDYVSYALHQASRVMASANGGQVFLSPDVATAIRDLPEATSMVALGPFVLRDFEGPVELVELRHAARPEQVPPPRAPSATVHNLPPQRTSFVGRQREVAELSAAVRRGPLVTLVGPGGVGKTRLAVRVAEELAGEFRDGVYLVRLQSIDNGRLVTEAVVRALGLEDSGQRRARDVLVEWLNSRVVLLLFDNCEHVLDDAAALIEDLLEEIATLTVLATSRESMTLNVEHVTRIHPLEVPDPDAPLEEVEASAAVELFCQRARQTGVVIDLAAHAGTVTAICTALAGIPLALELVAGRAAEDGLEQLLAAAQRGALDAARRGGDPRHRTLRSAIRWSYDLLEEDARVVLRRTAVMPGGFTHASAAAVSGAKDASSALSELVRCSLVERNSAIEPPRFRALEPVRVFAREELEHLGEAMDTWRAAADWMFSIVTSDAQQGDRMDRVAPEMANLFAILDDQVEVEPDAAARLLRFSESIFVLRGFVTQGERYVDLLLDRPLSEPRRLDVMLFGAVLAMARGDVTDMDRHLTPARVLAQRVGDQERLATMLNYDADLHRIRGEHAEAADAARRSAELFYQIGELVDACQAERSLATALAALGRRLEAAEVMQRALDAARRSGDSSLLAATLAVAGEVFLAAGEIERARRVLTEAVDLAEQRGDFRTLSHALVHLVETALIEQDISAAAHELPRAQRAVQRAGDQRSGAGLHALSAALSLRGDAPEEALGSAAQALSYVGIRSRHLAQAVVVAGAALCVLGRAEAGTSIGFAGLATEHPTDDVARNVLVSAASGKDLRREGVLSLDDAVDRVVAIGRVGT